MIKPRIVFAGTPEFALFSLRALVDAGYEVVAVYTQPDRPAGRGRRLSASPVKSYALEQGLTVMQPETLRDPETAAQLAALRPDLVVVAAYGLILPQQVLDIPTHGCLNVHASLLPRWRGAAPIQAAILADDRETGISLMRMTAGLDCGAVYSTRSIAIGETEAAGELHDRLAVLGGQLLVADLPGILDGNIVAVAQDESRACYAGKISKQDAELDWSQPAADLQRRVRAYNPVPGAFFFAADDVRVKVWQAAVIPDVDEQPGRVVQYDGEGIVVACGRGGLQLESLQLPGKRRVPPHEFVSQINLPLELPTDKH
ncbi:MAG: methionyl-tRNA formyltransferase [Gammaproteobacteria bacterium]|nr:methionyl-tRNA formyltransferase [Gammaproteobacteria bacterium]MDH5582626.1 methionyl-tRNA formyltransferase [Gammaproteobacteria bacterium]